MYHFSMFRCKNPAHVTFCQYSAKFLAIPTVHQHMPRQGNERQQKYPQKQRLCFKTKSFLKLKREYRCQAKEKT